MSLSSDCLEQCVSVALLHVGLEEHRWSKRAWQVSQTLTGFGEAGRGSSLSEQLLQKISPQFRQWCWRESEREPHYRNTVMLGLWVQISSCTSFEDRPFVSRWRTPSHTACSGWRPCPSTKPDPPETQLISVSP